MVAPAIMHYATDAQKSHYLPRIRQGIDWWAQGYSEPGAGSDLASLKCAAVRDGDDYILNGTKIWTTHAHCCNKMFCLVRTDNSGHRSKALPSCYLISIALGSIFSPLSPCQVTMNSTKSFLTTLACPSRADWALKMMVGQWPNTCSPMSEPANPRQA